MSAAHSRSIKTRITTAAALFPLSMAAAGILWYADTDFSLESFLALVMLLTSTVALRVFSNAVQLIRVRSWAVASLFIITEALCSHIYGWSPLNMAGCMLLLTYTISLLLSHQSPRPQTPVFAATVSVALLTMIMPQLAWLMPICLLSLLTPLRSFTPRALSAVAFGLLLPYLAFFCWHIHHDSAATALQEMDAALRDYAVPLLSDIVTTEISSGKFTANPSTPHLHRLCMCLFGLVGIVHFLHTRYNDKVRTRIYYTTIIMHWPAITLLQFFTTGHDSLLATMAALYNSVLLAHYFVFAKGWVANTLFWFFVLLCCCLTLPVC